MALKAKISVDTKDVKKSLDNTKAQAEKSMTLVGRALDQASKGMSGMQNAAKGLLSTLGGWGSAAAGGLAVFTAAVSFAFKQFSKFKEQAKNIKIGAEKSNMKVEDYSKLSYVAQQTGVSIESLTNIIDKLSEAIDKTSTGNSKYLAFWNALRISLVKLKGMTPVDKINEISAAIKNFKGDLKDIPFIEEIMGKSNMQNLQNLGKFDVNAVVERGKAMGLVIDEKQVNAVMNWHKSMDSASTATMMAVTQTLNYVEALEKLSKWMNTLQASTNPPKGSGFVSYDQAYAEEVKRLAFAGGRHGRQRITTYDEFLKQNIDFSIYGKEPDDKDFIAEVKKNPKKYGINVSEEEYYTPDKLALYNTSWWERNKELIEQNVLKKYPSFAENPNQWALAEGDQQATSNRNIIHLDTYASSLIGKENKRSLIEIDDINRKAESQGRAQSTYAQAQSYLDMMEKLKKLAAENLSEMSDEAFKSLQGLLQLNFKDINTSNIDVDAIVLEAESETSKKLSDNAKQLLHDIAAHLKGLKLDENKIKEIQELYRSAVEEATFNFKEESKKRLTSFLDAVETSKVENAEYGDVTALIKEIAESAGQSVEDWLDTMKKNFSAEHPETNGMNKLDYNMQFNQWISDNLESIVSEWAAKMDGAGNIPSNNDIANITSKILDRLREKTELTIRQTLEKIVKNAEEALAKAENQLNPRLKDTLNLDFTDSLKELNVTEEQYSKNKHVKAAVDKLTATKQRTREINVESRLKSDEENYQYKADEFRFGKKEAERNREYREAAKQLGVAVDELPAKFKEAIDTNIEKNFEFDDLTSQYDKLITELSSVRGRTAQDNTRTYTNELARKGGWNESVVVQKDDSWKDRIMTIAKLQEKIFSTESAINNKLGD